MSEFNLIAVPEAKIAEAERMFRGVAGLQLRHFPGCLIGLWASVPGLEPVPFPKLDKLSPRVIVYAKSTMGKEESDANSSISVYSGRREICSLFLDFEPLWLPEQRARAAAQYPRFLDFAKRGIRKIPLSPAERAELRGVAFEQGADLFLRQTAHKLAQAFKAIGLPGADAIVPAFDRARFSDVELSYGFGWLPGLFEALGWGDVFPHWRQEAAAGIALSPAGELQELRRVLAPFPLQPVQPEPVLLLATEFPLLAHWLNSADIPWSQASLRIESPVTLSEVWPDWRNSLGEEPVRILSYSGVCSAQIERCVSALQLSGNALEISLIPMATISLASIFQRVQDFIRRLPQGSVIELRLRDTSGEAPAGQPSHASLLCYRDHQVLRIEQIFPHIDTHVLNATLDLCRESFTGGLNALSEEEAGEVSGLLDSLGDEVNVRQEGLRFIPEDELSREWLARECLSVRFPNLLVAPDDEEIARIAQTIKRLPEAMAGLSAAMGAVLRGDSVEDGRKAVADAMRSARSATGEPTQLPEPSESTPEDIVWHGAHSVFYRPRATAASSIRCVGCHPRSLQELEEQLGQPLLEFVHSQMTIAGFRHLGDLRCGLLSSEGDPPYRCYASADSGTLGVINARNFAEVSLLDRFNGAYVSTSDGRGGIGWPGLSATLSHRLIARGQPQTWITSVTAEHQRHIDGMVGTWGPPDSVPHDSLIDAARFIDGYLSAMVDSGFTPSIDKPEPAQGPLIQQARRIAFYQSDAAAHFSRVLSPGMERVARGHCELRETLSALGFVPATGDAVTLPGSILIQAYRHPDNQILLIVLTREVYSHLTLITYPAIGEPLVTTDLGKTQPKGAVARWHGDLRGTSHFRLGNRLNRLFSKHTSRIAVELGGQPAVQPAPVDSTGVIRTVLALELIRYLIPAYDAPRYKCPDAPPNQLGLLLHGKKDTFYRSDAQRWLESSNSADVLNDIADELAPLGFLLLGDVARESAPSELERIYLLDHAYAVLTLKQNYVFELRTHLSGGQLVITSGLLIGSTTEHPPFFLFNHFSLSKAELLEQHRQHVQELLQRFDGYALAAPKTLAEFAMLSDLLLETMEQSGLQP